MKESTGVIEKKALIRKLSLGMGFSLVVFSLGWVFKPLRYSASYPFVSKITREELACEALADSMIYADKQEGVIGEVSKGTDKISIKIANGKFQFLSKASFESGELEGRPFTLLRNDKYVVAVDYDDMPMLNFFIMNRETGMAIWTKGRISPLLFGENPDSQSIYLICR